MILIYGLVGFILLPFIALAIGIWMCLLLLKVSFIVIVAFGCFIFGLISAIANRRNPTRGAS